MREKKWLSLDSLVMRMYNFFFLTTFWIDHHHQWQNIIEWWKKKFFFCWSKTKTKAKTLFISHTHTHTLHHNRMTIFVLWWWWLHSEWKSFRNKQTNKQAKYWLDPGFLCDLILEEKKSKQKKKGREKHWTTENKNKNDWSSSK